MDCICLKYVAVKVGVNMETMNVCYLTHGHDLTLWQIRMDDIFVAVIFCLRTLVCGGKVKIKFI